MAQHHFHCRPWTIREFLLDQHLDPPGRPSRVNRTAGEASDCEKTQDVCACVVYACSSSQEAIPVVSGFEPQPSTSAAGFAIFVELEGHGNVTTPSSIVSPSFSFRMSRPLNDTEIEEALMFNESDDDSDEDDNDEIRVPVMFPPYMRLQAEEHTLEEAEDELSPLPPSLPPRICLLRGHTPGDGERKWPRQTYPPQRPFQNTRIARLPVVTNDSCPVSDVSSYLFISY
ncbi:hypothetical protein EVAR_32003_1 [Eumeta japonica]|uniref:Uncharacterized protein n=1 Tax=Eumeta variegata TaxID=151549 RepID=A0A4C2AFM6_EUMVA|nr:hypothetical protein EVAR_32003_1 [Eumeta japonica]